MVWGIRMAPVFYFEGAKRARRGEDCSAVRGGGGWVSQEVSYDVYVKTGVNRAGEDVFGKAVAHFRKEGNAKDFAWKLEMQGETVHVQQSMLFDASETVKEQ